MTGPDDIIDLAAMPEAEFFTEATGTMVVLATVGGYHRGTHPAVVLTLWAREVALQLCDCIPLEDWDLVRMRLADNLEERAHVE